LATQVNAAEQDRSVTCGLGFWATFAGNVAFAADQTLLVKLQNTSWLSPPVST
jgi:hypothetical protein